MSPHLARTLSIPPGRCKGEMMMITVGRAPPWYVALGDASSLSILYYTCNQFNHPSYPHESLPPLPAVTHKQTHRNKHTNNKYLKWSNRPKRCNRNFGRSLHQDEVNKHRRHHPLLLRGIPFMITWHEKFNCNANKWV